jgi:zinc protease
VATVSFASLAARKWRLRNGLEIVTLPDPEARGVSLVTAFRVGARDEDVSAGEAGLAHLFEHLMFGRLRAADGANPSMRIDFDQRIEELGGIANAETSHDFTSYIDEIPPDALEPAVRLEASRMTGLDLDADQITRERAIVAAERANVVDDSVDGLLDELLYAQAFRTHPYGRPVIGSMQDIQTLTMEKAVAFYRRNYAPPRTVVIVSGRFDQTAALAMIAAAYGSFPAGPAAPTPASAPEAPASGVARTTVLRPVTAERLVLGFASPALGDPDRAAFEVLIELLAGGPSSRLARSLILEHDIASAVTSDIAVSRDPGLWSLWVQLTVGHGADQAEALIRQEIERLLVEPVPRAEIVAARNRLETQFWRRLSPSRERAMAVALFEMAGGGIAQLSVRGGAHAQVTLDDLRRVARADLAGGPRSVASARPGAERAR